MCKIIAEIGWNHMGDMALAKTMIETAKHCGADYAKFQTWSVKNLKSGPWDKDGRREIYEKAELTKEMHHELKEYCYSVGIGFLTSVFNRDDIAMIKELGCEEIKIPSTEAVNYTLLSEAMGQFKHLFISTGGLTEDELDGLQTVMKEDYNPQKCTILHCVSLYPCPLEKANLFRMSILSDKFACGIGYSDHTQGVSAAIAAIACDAIVIEKHFTIDRSLPGRDNQFACSPNELRQICGFRDDYEEIMRTARFDRFPEENGIVDYRGRWGN